RSSPSAQCRRKLAECLRWGYEAGLKRDTDELGRARRPELGSELAAIIRGGLVADADRVGDFATARILWPPSSKTCSTVTTPPSGFSAMLRRYLFPVCQTLPTSGSSRRPRRSRCSAVFVSGSEKPAGTEPA